MSLSSKVIISFIAFVFGIFFASFFIIQKKVFFLVLVPAIFLTICFYFLREKKKIYGKLFLFLLFFVFFLLGVFRLQLDNGRKITYKQKSFFPAISRQVEEKINEYFSPPQSSILLAITLGEKNKMSGELKNKLNFAGLRHMTAVSGMHIIIVSALFFWVFLAIGAPRKTAYFLSFFAIWLFIFLIGLQPSAIRAGIIASLIIFSQLINRPWLSINLVIYAAAIMLLANPYLLRWNLSFQLSFLASLGIVCLSPKIKNYLEPFLGKGEAANLLAVTLSAQIFVFPFLIYNFGRISLISPLSNLLVIPVLPLLMAFSFAFIFFSFVSSSIAFIISIFLWLFVKYVVTAINFFSSFPLGAVNFPNRPSIFVILLLYSIITWLSLRKNNCLKGNNLLA